MTAIRKGQSVTLLCSSFLEDGSCLDEDGPNDPLRMRAGSRGANEFSNTVARALVGMRANESKQLRVPARLAFGESDPKRIYKVPVTPSRSYKIGEEIKLKVNSNSSEEILEGVVVNVEGEFANVDTNHPLAGKSLLLNIKIISFN